MQTSDPPFRKPRSFDTVSELMAIFMALILQGRLYCRQ